jgi:hypothetical protein
MPPKGRKKTRKVRKDTSIQIRATVEQKETLNEFVTKLGQGDSLSGWMLRTCLQAVATAKAREADT